MFVNKEREERSFRSLFFIVLGCCPGQESRPCSTCRALPFPGLTLVVAILCLVLARPVMSQETTPEDSSTEILEAFASFSRDWIESCRRSFLFTSDRTQCLTENNCTVVVRYMDIDAASMEWQVKPTHNRWTPWVGVLVYTITTFESRAETEAAARAGTFVPSRTRKVTEIFRYARGAWQP